MNKCTPRLGRFTDVGIVLLRDTIEVMLHLSFKMLEQYIHNCGLFVYSRRPQTTSEVNEKESSGSGDFKKDNPDIGKALLYFTCTEYLHTSLLSIYIEC